MKKFNQYFEDDYIIKYLCKMRAGIAHKRNNLHITHLLTKNNNYNYHTATKEDFFQKFNDEICSLMPKRRQWVTLRKNQRYKTEKLLSNIEESRPLSVFEKNELAIKLTIKKFKKKFPDADFYKRLRAFIEDIQNTVKQEKFSFEKPYTYPKRKKNGKPMCRPISMFGLKDHIIICLTNKYFTDLFDDLFFEKSFAFRAPKSVHNKYTVLNHHDSIKEIRNYCETQSKDVLWVAEYDIQKFYDSVNHTIIKRMFNSIYSKIKRNNPEFYSEAAKNVLYEYLNSYKFNKDVYPKNYNDADHFKKHKIHKGQYEWIEKELKEHKFYKNTKIAKIGIPQGGALSGLIANIVLDYVDKEIQKNLDKNSLYIRYCDDMILMHPDKAYCSKLCDIYANAINKLKLVHHYPNSILEYTKSSYWKDKSKGPYPWANTREIGYPWISFVGYDMRYNGSIKIRRSSLRKEMTKQYNSIEKIKNAVKKERRKSDSSIKQTLMYRLIGMSVGRVNMKNYHKTYNEKMCWLNGFKEINDNKYLIAQLKMLDKCRNKLFNKFEKWLIFNNLDKSKIKKSKKDKQISRNLPFYYGLPYSYYYQGMLRIKYNNSHIQQNSVSVTGQAVDSNIPIAEHNDKHI